ncbi:hypothetical protein OSTOST_19001 [Ostertagia ostertagi]
MSEEDRLSLDALLRAWMLSIHILDKFAMRQAPRGDMGFITTQLPYTGRAATLRIGRTFADSRLNANATQIAVPQMPTWKKYARIVLPHVGLILLSLLYVVGGAVAFYHMERPNEAPVKAIASSRSDGKPRLLVESTLLNRGR